MDNIAYNYMYRNIICNRLEEYTILYIFFKVIVMESYDVL